MKRTSLTAIGAVLALIALSGCGDDPSGGDGTPSPSATTVPATESPADPSPSASIAVDEVTEAQKKACLDAILEQLRAKKGGDMPQECAILPSEVVAEVVDKALSGG